MWEAHTISRLKEFILTLKEYLKLNHSKYCYKAGNVTEHIKETKAYRLVGEVWLLPLTILNDDVIFGGDNEKT